MNRRKAQRKQTLRNQKILALRKRLKVSLAIGFSVCALLVAFSSFADAHNQKEKYYTSVMVEPGDSLWTLANEYRTEDFRDNNSYIKEVKKLNHMTSDQIHEGSYLVLPYYE